MAVKEMWKELDNEISLSNTLNMTKEKMLSELTLYDLSNELNKRYEIINKVKNDEIKSLHNIIIEIEKAIQENKFWIYDDVLETRENFEVIDIEYITDIIKKVKGGNNVI